MAKWKQFLLGLLGTAAGGGLLFLAGMLFAIYVAKSGWILLFVWPLSVMFFIYAVVHLSIMFFVNGLRHVTLGIITAVLIAILVDFFTTGIIGSMLRLF